MAKKITQDLLDFWLHNNNNVLFIGRAGVGKTAMIKECFDRNKLNWKYFSASTLDPWVDFCGIPRIVPNKSGSGQHIEYVLPEFFADDSIEAIFLDEFNRGQKKITNAVMELIQFKSINGKKFKNLKVVWAAVNPKAETEEDEEYQVEPIDPAIEDRFQIHVEVPYAPDMAYFGKHYGSDGRNAVDWWKELDKKVQNKISPRRLEYALKTLSSDGDVSFVLPQEASAKQFIETIANGSLLLTAENLMKGAKVSDAKDWLLNPNNSSVVVAQIEKKRKGFMEFFVPILPVELLTQQIAKTKSIRRYVLENEINNKEYYSPILDSIVSSDQNKAVIRDINKNRSVKVGNVLEFAKHSRKIRRWDTNTQERWNVFKEMVSIDLNDEKIVNLDAASRLKNAHILYKTMAYLAHHSREATMIANSSNLSIAHDIIYAFSSVTDIIEFERKNKEGINWMKTFFSDITGTMSI